VTLVACTNTTSKTTSQNNHSSQVHRTNMPSKNNQKIAKQLATEFNTNAKVVTTKVETAVVDDQSKQDKKGHQLPHQAIQVMVTDKTIITKLKSIENKIRGGKASTDEKLYIIGIQETISKAAKKLNNSDTVDFGYQDDQNNTSLIAKSMKNKDIIKQVTIAP